jgi:putative tryptophan/tyrosine transport system substrate-binding protein
LVPDAPLLAFLVSSERNGFDETETAEVQKAAKTLGVRLLVVNANVPSEFDDAFATAAHERAGGLLVNGFQFFGAYTDRIIELAARYRLPAMYTLRKDAAAGGLVSYGAIPAEAWRLGGVYAGRILKGEKPADLPVQQVTKFELVINLNTAKALGISVPLSLRALAAEVIEWSDDANSSPCSAERRRGRWLRGHSSRHCHWSRSSTTGRPMLQRIVCAHSAQVSATPATSKVKT